MKQLLTVLMAVLPFIAAAQKGELGLSGGIGFLAPPSGSIYYKADQSGTSPLIGLTYLGNFDPRSESRIGWQAGIEANCLMNVKQESSTTYQYFGDTIGNDGRYFLYAKYMISVAPVINIKYKLSGMTYVYGGVSIGVVGTINTANRKPQDFEGADYTYTAPDGGTGLCAGLHIGINQRIAQRIAVAVQVGARYNSIGYHVDDHKYPGGTSFRYNSLVIPATIGLRYRMGWEKQYNSAKGRYEIAEEDVHRKSE